MFKKKKEDTKGEAKPKKAKKQHDILVKVSRAHMSPVEITLNGDRSVQRALDDAGLSKKDSEIVTVDGEEVDSDDLGSIQLEDGQRVSLVRNVQGGAN